MSSADENSSADDSKEASQAGFVAIIRDYPIIFQKSQTPATRKLKNEKLSLIRETYQKNFGTEITTPQLLKKISNIRARIKKKKDTNRTGNKKIRLKEWEEQIMKMMQGDTNPALNTIPGMEKYYTCFVNFYLILVIKPNTLSFL